MIILATENELDLSGTPAELRAVSRALTHLGPGESFVLAAERGVSPAPYDRLLDEFQALASGGPVRLTVVGARLMATGSRETFSCLASFFDFPDDAKPGAHSHHEWYSDSYNAYIAPDSRPLVISVRSQKPSA